MSASELLIGLKLNGSINNMLTVENIQLNVESVSHTSPIPSENPSTEHCHDEDSTNDNES